MKQQYITSGKIKKTIVLESLLVIMIFKIRILGMNIFINR